MNFNLNWNICLAILVVLLSLRASAATYNVGPTQTYTTMNSLPPLNPGDLVQVYPGTYHETMRFTRAGTSSSPIVIRGVGATRPLFDGTGLTVDGAMPNPRAIFQVEASYVTIDNIEFKNAANGNNGAGVRITSTSGTTTLNTVISNCKITYCDMGMQCDSNDNLLVSSCEVAFNGTSLNSGYSHNFYLNGNKTTVQFCYIHDSLYGQNFKTRGHYTELFYNTIANSQDGEVCLVDSALTATANSNAVMIGNIIISKVRLSGWNDARYVWFGQDSGGAHTGTLYAMNNTFYTYDYHSVFVNANATGSSAVMQNNICFGSNNIVGGTVSGSNNWLPSTAPIPSGLSASVVGSDPLFVNPSARDFHLTSGSGCIDAGTSSLTYHDLTGASFSGTPTQEYVVDLGSVARTTSGNIDIGAYEFHSASAPSITTSSLPVGEVGTAYTLTTFAATGGTAPYTWSVSTGSLPAGLSLSSAGAISGTPTTAGTSSFTVKVTDSASASSTKALSITINAAPSITTTSPLAAGDVSIAYSKTFAVSGGTSPFTWSVSTGTLPAGLTLSAAGVLSGTPTAAGTSSFTIKVTDAAGAAPTKTFSLTINAAPSITTASLPAGMVGVAYSQTLAGTGGTTPYTWSVASGALPAGLSLTSAGVLSGTPTTAGTSSFTVQLTDSLSASSTKALSITINAAPSITTTSPLAAGEVNVAYSKTFAVSGGTSPFTWSVSSGTLPAGLTLSAAGVLSGTPTTAGTSSFTIKVTDATGAAPTKAFSLTINAAPSITTASLPNGTVGVAYSQTLAGTGGTTPYSWMVASGTLPAGVSLSSAGVLGGTPTTAGTSSFTVKLSDAVGGSATHAYSLTVNASTNSAPTITSAGTANPNPAGVGQSVTFTVAANDADGDTLSYSWTFGDGASGSGNSTTHAYTAAGSYTAKSTVSDGHGNTVTSSVTVSVLATPAPVITSSTTASGTTGSTFSYTITATNTPTSYNATPLPPGLSVTASTGTISGTPSAAGTFSITISATNSGGTGSATLTLTVASGPVGYWKLDDGSGASAADSSGFGNTGTLVNGPTWTTGQINGALALNGSNQYVTVLAPSGSSIDLDKTPVSIAAWVKTNTTTVQQAILVRGLSNGVGQGNQGYGLWINSNGKINVGSAGGGNFSSSAAITANAWHQVTAIINGTASKVYIDGVDQTPASVNIGVVTSSLSLTIGASHNNAQTGYVGFFNGTLDDVRVYNRALSASDAAALAGTSGAAPAAVAASVAVSPAEDSGTLSVTKMQAGVTFGASNHDSCTISGTISGLPAGFSPAGQTFVVNVMGAAGSFTLDAKGRGKSSQGSVALKAGKSGALSFQAKLIGDCAAAWSLTPPSTKASWKMDMWVSVDLAGNEYSGPLSVTYSGSSRGAKLKK
jgi:hypothetical protein